MSRSFKHSPCISWVSYFSNKKDKQVHNRRFRRISKYTLKFGGVPPIRLREICDTYSFSSDGLASWVPDLDSKYLRK